MWQQAHEIISQPHNNLHNVGVKKNNSKIKEKTIFCYENILGKF